MPSISATLIVRDACDSIAECLQSFIENVDEVVVVDTGSVDGTLEVLEDLRRAHSHLRIEHFAWIDDFAAARNAALDHATGDWVLWIDADDVAENAHEFRRLAADQPDDVRAVYLPYDVRPGTTFWRERLVRRGQYRWAYPVHETLCLVEGTSAASRTVRSEVARIVHRKEEESHDRTNERNLAIHRAYHEQLSAEGELADGRSYFYFANDLHAGGYFEEAIRRYWQAIAVSTWHDERYQAHHYVAECLRKMGRPGEAIAVYLLALEVDPSWPDAYFGIAKCHYSLMDWEQVVSWTARGFEHPRVDTLCVTFDDDYDYWPNWYLAWAHLQLGNLAAARAAAAETAKVYRTSDTVTLMHYLDRVAPAAHAPS